MKRLLAINRCKWTSINLYEIVYIVLFKMHHRKIIFF